MKTDVDFTQPEEVLTAFWETMNEWELEAARSLSRHRKAGTSEKWNEDWKPIFALYCTDKTRVYGENRPIGTPSQYDPRSEKIVEVTYPSIRRCIIKSKRTTKVKRGPNHEKVFFYVLYKKGGKWLVDNTYYFDHEGKISRRIL